MSKSVSSECARESVCVYMSIVDALKYESAGRKEAGKGGREGREKQGARQAPQGRG